MHADSQKLESKTTTELLVSLQQNKKREAAKQKQETAKRPASANAGPGPSSKRQQTARGTAASSPAEQPADHKANQYTVQQLQTKSLKELTVMILSTRQIDSSSSSCPGFF